MGFALSRSAAFCSSSARDALSLAYTTKRYLLPIMPDTREERTISAVLQDGTKLKLLHLPEEEQTESELVDVLADDASVAPQPLVV